MGILSSCEIDGEKRHEPSALIHGKSHEKSCAKEAEGNGKGKNEKPKPGILLNPSGRINETNCAPGGC